PCGEQVVLSEPIVEGCTRLSEGAAQTVQLGLIPALTSRLDSIQPFLHQRHGFIGALACEARKICQPERQPPLRSGSSIQSQPVTERLFAVCVAEVQFGDSTE